MTLRTRSPYREVKSKGRWPAREHLDVESLLFTKERSEWGLIPGIP